MMKGNIFISKVVRHFKTYFMIIVKKSELPEYFDQKFLVKGKIARKSTYSFPTEEQLWKVNAKTFAYFSQRLVL